MFPIAKLEGIDTVFGPRSCFAIMPTRDECAARRDEWRKYEGLVNAWFFCGLSKLECMPRKGVEEKDAIRHISAILRSFEPKHEHKTAAVAYLINEWFVDVKWEAAEKTP